MTTSRIGTIGYQATSAGVRSEYSSMILNNFLIRALQERRAAKTAVSPLIRSMSNCKSFPKVRYFGFFRTKGIRQREGNKRQTRTNARRRAVDSGEAFTRNSAATFNHFAGDHEFLDAFCEGRVYIASSSSSSRIIISPRAPTFRSTPAWRLP
jgi:hypothetical protein